MRNLKNDCLKLLKNNISYFFIFLLLYFLPKINEFFRIYFIQSDINQLDILSQITWLQATLEILQAFLIAPLFYLLEQNKKNPLKIFYFVLLFCFLFICIGWSGGIWLIAKIVNYDINSHYLFLYFQWLNGCLEFVVLFFTTLFLIKEKRNILVLFVSLKFTISFFIDLIFLNYTDFGVYSVNTSSIFSNLVLIVSSIYYCVQTKIFIYKSLIKNYKIYYMYIKKQFFSKEHMYPAIEQLLDNTSYIVVILTSLNLMHKNSEYFTAMAYFWGIILALILSFGNIIQKIIAGKDKISFKNKLIFVFLTNNIFVFLFITSYFYIDIIANLVGLNLNNQISNIIKSLYLAYIIFHLSYSIKCIFYALGLFKFTFLISIMVNALIYLPYYFSQNTIKNIDTIINIFSNGIYFNFIVSLILFMFLISYKKQMQIIKMLKSRINFSNKLRQNK
ncbi:hypothetical protein A7X81_06960 [Campylobacter ornithocola]|uniref:Uncharacterized protein n=1 Tax=Campylobacter ornithocola TaxID=1848766 RepID=A0A6M8N0B4_9BACT|nr:hypothetical protein [Campylobacter ornithocola]OCX42947.1 hypothetical protein A7X81_06960 [Campylobacter ornithocola]QKF56591.1 putative membrane protein [Campylobacter ornithocola]